MATKEYQIQGEHTTGLTAKHYHGEAISTLNTWAKNNLPPYAVVSSVKVKYRGKVSTGDTKFYVGFTNSSDTKPGQKIISGELTTSSNNSWEQPLPFSGLNITSSYSRLNFWASSGIVMKKYTCYDFRVIWTYSIATYTVTVKAGTGGTVEGGGTFEAGKTATITATPNTGYKFKQWNDGDTRASRSVTVTKNTTYTAEFELLEYPVVIDYQESASGEKCTVSGAGTYKFGDTVTLKVTSVPAYHTFNGCDVFTGKGVHQYDTETITFTLNTDFIRGDEASITVLCYITHTGYRVNVEKLPYEGAGYAEYGDWGIVEGKETYFNRQRVPINGFKVVYANRDVMWIEAIANEGYAFIRWQDGNTSNPRKIVVTGDITYTAIFKVNKLYIGKQVPKAIYIGTQEVKEVYVGTEKVYG